jgi:hypothetical protein
MFEQNNVGIRLKNPVCEYYESLTVDSIDLDVCLSNLEQIVTSIEGKLYNIQYIIDLCDDSM